MEASAGESLLSKSGEHHVSSTSPEVSDASFNKMVDREVNPAAPDATSNNLVTTGITTTPSSSSFDAH